MVLLPLMDDWQKTYRQACAHGYEELGLSEESKNSSDLSLSRHVPVAVVEQMHMDGSYCRGARISSIYEDCLSMLGEALGQKDANNGIYGDQACGREDGCGHSQGEAAAKRVEEHERPYNESMFSCIHSEAECLDLIECTRRGAVQRVKRRLNEREKSLIRPGSIFVYKEQESGIRRWTDKKEWAPSRVVGTFLAYRDLNGVLYKKTFSKQISNERYHVVIYTSYEWERNGTCCAAFGKSRDCFLWKKAGCSDGQHSPSEEASRHDGEHGSILGPDGFGWLAARPDASHKEFVFRDHFCLE